MNITITTLHVIKLLLFFYLRGFFVRFIENCQYDYMEEQAKDWLDNVYAPNNYKYNINSTQAAWEYYTNINDETSAAQVRLSDYLLRLPYTI